MENIIQFAAVGFIAQLIDGAIGMAYGITSSSILLALGVNPVVASASVHAAEVFTTGTSALSHWRLGNIDRSIFKRLLIPGMLGGGAGAYILSEIPNEFLRPVVSAYLLVMAITILCKAIRPMVAKAFPSRGLPPLAFIGAMLDAIGGGGWGPIVTSSMIGWGIPPRVAIGTSNAVEFFVTTVIAGALFPHVTGEMWNIVLGLVIGGVVAAPFAAVLTKRLPVRLLMGMVGTTVFMISLNDLSRAWAAW
jgi:uncharacterized membrane protein YfcA